MTITKEKIFRRTVTLLGASEVLIREAGPEDAEALRRMFSRCSKETIYLRFHLPLPSVPDRLIALLVGGAAEGGGRALVAVDGDEVVGHVMYARDEEDDTEAEVAVVIEDEWQARGLGTLLLSEIAEEARQAGVETLTGIVLAKKRRILNLTRRVLPGCLCSFGGGTCVIRASLATPLAEAEPSASLSRKPDRPPARVSGPRGPYPRGAGRRIEDGHALVPDGPGIGLEWDEEAVSRFLVR